MGKNVGKKAGRAAEKTLDRDEKHRIACQEVETLTKDIQNTKKTAEQNLDLLKALMEETEIRQAEVKRAAYEFRRDIVVGAENPRTGKTMAEKVLKYLEDELTTKDVYVRKMLAKNQTYKTQINKAQRQLKSKQDHDDLQYIDFHQLQIENQQFVVKIEEANQELLQLKKTSGRTVKLLNSMKKKLTMLMSEAKFLRDEIEERKAMLKKSEADTSKVVEEKEAARKDHKKLKVQSRISNDMPQVVDYVQQTADQYELEAMVRNWRRKVDISELAAKRIRTKLRAQGMSET